jgi:hypothetical protein
MIPESSRHKTPHIFLDNVPNFSALINLPAGVL